MRLTSSKNVNYNALTIWTLGFIGILYYVSAASYLFVFDRTSINDNSFNLFKREGGFLSMAYLFYFPNNIYTYVMNSIFATEILETLPFIRKILNDGHGNTSRPKIILLRIISWALSVAISLSTRDVINVLNVSGSLFTPVVSYFAPVLLS